MPRRPDHLQSRSNDVRVVFVGHAGHGKSTLVDRILHDGHAPPGGPFDGATFASGRRRHEAIDAPGDPERLASMMSGATRADAAVLVVAADEGLREQSFRHALLLRLAGIDRILVVVGKMDLHDYSEDRFHEVANGTEVLLASIGAGTHASIPVAASHGENVAREARRMPWYEGPTLLEALDRLPVDRESVRTDPDRPSATTDRAVATVFWMGQDRAFPSLDPVGVVRTAGDAVPVRISAVNRRFESDTLDEILDRSRLGVTDVAEVDLAFERPVVLETRGVWPPLGRITIEADRDVLAAGVIRRIPGRT